MAEALGALFLKAENLGVIDVLKACRNGDSISHLPIADDTVLFSSTNWEGIITFKRILECQELVLGLKVNLSRTKSMLVGVGCLEECVK